MFATSSGNGLEKLSGDAFSNETKKTIALTLPPVVLFNVRLTRQKKKQQHMPGAYPGQANLNFEIAGPLCVWYEAVPCAPELVSNNGFFLAKDRSLWHATAFYCRIL